MPRVSIGLPVYNGENFIEQALDSILSQSWLDFELIISDNASTDRTQEICQAYAAKDRRIRYYRNEKNIGAARNYNRVLELSRSQYFKWAAHDDVLAPTYLERCVEVLDREPEVVLCFPGITYINEHGEILSSQEGDLSLVADSAGARMQDIVDHELESTDIFWAVFGLIRRDALRRTSLIGSYHASDQVLLMQLLLLGKFYQITENLYFRREHPLASMNRHRTAKERMAWFDPCIKKKIVWCHWSLLFKHFDAIRRSPLQIYQRIWCYYEVLRRFVNEWRTLGGEFKLVARQLMELML